MHPVPAHSSCLSARGCAPALHGAASPAQRTAGECANIDYAEKIHNCQMRLTPPYARGHRSCSKQTAKNKQRGRTARVGLELCLLPAAPGGGSVAAGGQKAAAAGL